MNRQELRDAHRALTILDFVNEVDIEPTHYTQGRLKLTASNTGNPEFSLRNDEAKLVYGALRQIAADKLAALGVTE